MRIRAALKLCRMVYGFDRKAIGKSVRWNGRRGTLRKAVAIGRKKWGDERFPCIPSKEEEEEQAEIMCGFLAGLAVKLGEEAGVSVPDEIRDVAFDLSGF